MITAFLSDLSKLPEQDELMSGYIKMLKKNENDCEIWVNLGVILAESELLQTINRMFQQGSGDLS